MTAPDRPAAARAIEAFLRAIGRDPDSEPELRGTGGRVADAFLDELSAGYAIDTRAIIEGAAIDAGAGEANSGSPLVVLRELPVVTTCPHHLMPASGTADVAVQAHSRLVGIGAIADLVDAHARRLTLQEQIGEAVVADLDAVLSPAWVACRLRLTHGCFVARRGRSVATRIETLAVRNVAATVAATLFSADGPAR
jgi:GTP cyclohydrolase I